MKITFITILSLLLVMLLGACDSSNKERPAGRESINVPKVMKKKKPAQGIPADALAKVGDRYITVTDYKKHSTGFSPKLAESASGRRHILNQYVEGLLIEKEAESRGLTRAPDIAAKIEDYARALYKKNLRQRLKKIQRPITDEEVKKYFQDHKDSLIKPDRVRISVLELDLNKRKEIDTLYRELRAGKDFAKLAMDHSKHVSARKGGGLGFLTRKQYKPLTESAFALKPGRFSKPFKTTSGWTIIKVTDFIKRQDVSAKDGLKRARARLEAIEASSAFSAFIKDLKGKNQVVIYKDRLSRIVSPPRGVEQKQGTP